MNVYRELMLRAANLSLIADPLVRDRCGCFLHSCVNHVEADQTSAWESYAIGPGRSTAHHGKLVIMRDAILSWHSSLRDTSGGVDADHTFIDCQYKSEFGVGGEPVPCNPSCASSQAAS